ncbi:hypothetical protein G9A89_000848 [Geosiphon pyriformis]|nr:hypothetical protein G9A89_000848 [Geosiphon pyriformis]
MISVVTETMLKEKVHPWIINKFDGSGYLGAEVVIIMDVSLAKHVCKISEVPGQFISVKLLFKNKLSVTVLSLYTGATLEKRLAHSYVVNLMVAEALNGSTFVVLGSNFNKNDSDHSASFKKCLDLGLFNSLHDSSSHRLPTWSNSRGVHKCIDFILVSDGLRSSFFNQCVSCSAKFFDSDYLAVLVDIGLESFLSSQLNLIRRQAVREKWKYRVSDFGDASLAVASKAAGNFELHGSNGDINGMWTLLCLIVCSTAEATLVKTQSRDVGLVKTAIFSRSHRLEILVAKILDAYKTGNIWVDLDFDQTVIFKSSLGNGHDRVLVEQLLASFRKLYRSCKFLESKAFKDSRIQTAIEKHMEAFVDNKGQMIRSVLEKPFRKVTLNHLVDNGDLILESDLVKGRVDSIMENWTKKRTVKLSMPSQWQEQFSPLNHVDNSVFFGMMKQIDFGEFLLVVKNFLNDKAAGLSGISNEMWKHCDESVLVLFLCLFNLCLVYESVPDAWREAWVSMIPKPYEWDGVLMNTRPIALIKTSRKILSKILSDHISKVCSTHNILCEDNFSVLKDTSTQSPIFVVRSVIEDALEKDRELWLRIKMCEKFIRFFGSIHNGHTNRVMTDFDLSKGYKGEVFSPLLWRIFYDPLLCEVKKHESVFGY